MKELKYRLIEEGNLKGIYVPISIALVDYEDVLDCGISLKEACERIAKNFEGPIAINIWDVKNAVATTSDGIMVDGSVVAMAAADYGTINKEFGYAEMLEIPWDSSEAVKLMEDEHHMSQWKTNFPGRRFLSHPAELNLPVHQATITGRAGNNNSATEMMHYITMNELLMPLGGQIEIMRDGRVCVGLTGGIISVGIGMSIGEKYARIVPNGHLKAGDTLHGSGEFAQTLKAHIPIIAANKSAHAANIIKALNAGMIPGKDIGVSPAVLAVAKYLGKPIAIENITDRAWIELETAGVTREWLTEKVSIMTEEDVISNAEAIIPGIDNIQTFDSRDIVKVCYA